MFVVYMLNFDENVAFTHYLTSRSISNFSRKLSYGVLTTVLAAAGARWPLGTGAPPRRRKTSIVNRTSIESSLPNRKTLKKCPLQWKGLCLHCFCPDCEDLSMFHSSTKFHKSINNYFQPVKN